MMNVKELITPIIQLEARRRRNKQMVTFICVVVLLNTAWGLYYLAFGPKPKPVFTPANTSSVHVSAPSVVVTPSVPSAATRSHAMPTYTPARSSYQARPSYSSNSSGWRVVQTSDQRMQSYGGGSGGAGNVSNGGSNAGKRGISYGSGSVAVPVTSFVALGSNRMIADAGAQEAPQMAKMAAAPIRHAPGPPSITDPLPEDQQLIEHTPLPDGTIALALMVVIYAIGRFFAEKWHKKCA